MAELMDSPAEVAELLTAAMEVVGFDPGSQYAELALIVARSVGWGQYTAKLAEIADHPDFPCASDCDTHRKRSVRRALNELQRFGLLQWQKLPEMTYRRTRSEATYLIELNRRQVAAAAAGNPIVPLQSTEPNDDIQQRGDD